MRSQGDRPYKQPSTNSPIDVDRSGVATQLEFAMDTALASVPDLLDEVIERLSPSD